MNEGINIGGSAFAKGGGVSAKRDVNIIQNITNITNIITRGQHEEKLARDLIQAEMRLENRHLTEEEKNFYYQEIEQLKIKIANPQQSYEALLQEIEILSKKVEKLENIIPIQEIEQAKQALAQGELQAAYDLFKMLQQQQTQKAAEYAFECAEIARKQLRFSQALKDYHIAHTLDPYNADYISEEGLMLLELGEYARAKVLLERLYYGLVNQFGKNNRDVAIIGGNLAQAYTYTNELKEAQTLLRNALSFLGEDNQDACTTMNNLAIVYHNQRKYIKAKKLLDKVLAIRTQNLTEEHQDTLIAMNNLATVHEEMGEYPKAQELHEKTLYIRKRILKENHPETLSSINNLAYLYYLQKNYTDSKKLYEEGIPLVIDVLGGNHPNTLLMQDNYKLLLEAMK